jgi:hypothetical protein
VLRDFRFSQLCCSRVMSGGMLRRFYSTDSLVFTSNVKQYKRTRLLDPEDEDSSVLRNGDEYQSTRR